MKSLPETRYTLIGKLRNPQDAEAWAEFATIYHPVIFRFCRSKGLQHADATDITQDVLAKIVGAIEKFDLNGGKRNFRGWLFRITRNLVVDFVRKRERNVLVQFDPALELATKPSKEESVEFQAAFQKQVFLIVSQKVRRQVELRTWQAFWDTEIKLIPVEQVAKALSMSTGAVYVARSRVLTRFKNHAQHILNETNEHFVQ